MKAIRRERNKDIERNIDRIISVGDALSILDNNNIDTEALDIEQLKTFRDYEAEYIAHHIAEIVVNEPKKYPVNTWHTLDVDKVLNKSLRWKLRLITDLEVLPLINYKLNGLLTTMQLLKL